MRCEVPIGHAETVAGLFRAATRRRLGHALLFTGPDGVGKFLAAEQLGAGLLCARGPALPCGECGPCRRLRAGTHADLLSIDPEAEGEEQIKIERIVRRDRDSLPNVCEFLSLRPMEGGWRVVLVRDADRMNDEAQNALLKTLEEPGESTLLVLTTARPESLLPTTRSRCVPVVFAPLERSATEKILLARGLHPTEAARLARWSGGAPGAALALRERAAAEMRERIEGVLLGRIDPLAAAREIGELEGEFSGKTPTARARSRARACLDLALCVAADVARARAGVDPARLAHGDLAEAILAAGGARGIGSDAVWERRLELLLTARQDVDANLAPEILLERALLGLEPATSGAGAASAKHSPRILVPRAKPVP